MSEIKVIEALTEEDEIVQIQDTVADCDCVKIKLKKKKKMQIKT